MIFNNSDSDSDEHVTWEKQQIIPDSFRSVWRFNISKLTVWCFAAQHYVNQFFFKQLFF